eukprot:Clim_evm18s205 gene=Clim_evmTU18s205
MDGFEDTQVGALSPTREEYNPFAEDKGKGTSNLDNSLAHSESTTHSTPVMTSTVPPRSDTIPSSSARIVDMNDREGFVMYTIHFETDSLAYPGVRNYEIQRRYSDFVTFRKILVTEFPYHVLPPIPEKKLGSGRFDPHFVECRKTGLERFLKALLATPVISESRAVVRFMTEPRETLMEDFNRKGSKGILSTLNEQLQNLAVRFLKEKGPDGTGGAIDAVVADTHLLHDMLKKVESASATYATAEKRLNNNFSSLGPAFNNIANAELEVVDPYFVLSKAMDGQNHVNEKYIQNYIAEVTELLKYLLKYAESLIETLRRRDMQKMNNDLVEKELERAQSKLADMERQPMAYGSKFPQQRKKLKDKIENLTPIVQQNQIETDRASTDVESDLNTWHTFRKETAVKIIRSYMDVNRQHAEESIQLWESACSGWA